MAVPLTSTPHIWALYALLSAAIVGFAWDRMRVEVTSLLLLVALLLLFELFPFVNADGASPLDMARLLAGFSNPALISLLALLVLGNGLWRSGALDWGLELFLDRVGNRRNLAVGICFATVFVASPFVNNTPIVVIFIPILASVARRFSMETSAVMMPLSFTAILAGTITLIGSSTNLLISGALIEAGEPPLGFFEFSIPGLALASVGLLYIVLVMPRLLPRRASPARRFMARKHRRFVARFTVGGEAKLIGGTPRFNLLGIPGSRLLLLQRDGTRHAAPFDGIKIRKDDVLLVMATHDALAKAQTKFPHLYFSVSGSIDLPLTEDEREAWLSRDQAIVEVMIAPGSRLAGYSLNEVAFRSRYGCLILGIERNARLTRRHLADTQLREGDVLVVQGNRDGLERLREHRGLVVLDGTARALPSPRKARTAGAIFLGTLVVASSGALPITTASVLGVVLMLMTGVLSLNQAVNALDRRIFLMVAASLALGTAMLETGAAAYIARGVIDLVGTMGQSLILSALFLLVALLTNVLSNNATAILFTPIALGLANGLETAPTPFILAVLFGANCSFATPIGYQTNLLVMGPGHYRFQDFPRAGGPLVGVMWITFSLFVPWYYGWYG
jgi:di/tricarboxylate transporter